MQVYHQPVGEVAARALDAYFDTLADGRPAAIEILEVKGRKISVAAAAGEQDQHRLRVVDLAFIVSFPPRSR